jgi:Flp pilus assembly protein TadG
VSLRRKRLTGLWGRLWRDQRGVSAVEFALIAPVLITLYFGFAETTQAMMAKRRASHVASTIGDLVAQEGSVTDAEMADLFTIGRTMIAPFASTNLKMRITSVTANATGVVKVDWSDGLGLAGLAPGGNYAGIPAGLIAANQSLVISEVTYSYDSPIKKYLPNTLNWSDKYYLRPRQVNTVGRTAT